MTRRGEDLSRLLRKFSTLQCLQQIWGLQAGVRQPEAKLSFPKRWVLENREPNSIWFFPPISRYVLSSCSVPGTGSPAVGRDQVPGLLQLAF